MDDRDGRDLAGEVVEWLRGVAPGAVIRWGQDLEQPADGWLDGWVDVGVDHDEAPDCGWLWAVTGPLDGPDDDLPASSLYLVVDYDGSYWTVNSFGGLLASHLVEDDHDLDPEIRSSLEAIAADSDGELRSAGCWRVETVNRVLAEWTAVHAGRRDVSFIFDPEVRTGMFSEVLRRIEDDDREWVEWTEVENDP